LLASGFVLLLLEGKDSTLWEEPLFLGTGQWRGFGSRSGGTGAGILLDRREREREGERERFDDRRRDLELCGGLVENWEDFLEYAEAV
jgi:hypothetical protein